MMSVYYHGSDGHIKQLGDDNLQHWKYIKKVGNRYFYSLDELQAYYQDEKDRANREAASKTRERVQETNSRHDYQKERIKGSVPSGILYRDKKDNLRIRDVTSKEKAEYINREKKRVGREESVAKKVDKAKDTKISIAKKAKPLINTGRMLLLGKEKPKTTKSRYSQEDIARIRRKSQVTKARTENGRVTREKAKKKRQYSAASRW